MGKQATPKQKAQRDARQDKKLGVNDGGAKGKGKSAKGC
jgi:hypothetical protein